MNPHFLLPVLLILVGCSEPIPRDLDTLIQEGQREFFSDPETMSPYSGPVFRLSPDDSTRVVFRGTLKDGQFHGSFTEYDNTEWVRTGSEDILGLYQEGEYRDGLREGPFTYFYPSGVKRGEGQYSGGKQEGLYTSWFENGRLRLKRSYSNGERDGPGELYYENGQLYQRGSYSNGERDGPYEIYHENGQLESKGFYSNDERDGPYEAYYENGQLRLKGSISNGERCGEWFGGGETVTYDSCPTDSDEMN